MAPERGRWRADEAAAFPVFEAVLVAIFILTAILFVNSFAAPTADNTRGDINLAVVAADTLRVLENREPLDNVTYSDRLEEIVGLAMQGDSEESHALVKSLLGQETRYLLRLNNGVDDLHLMPNSSGVQMAPRGAKAAETFLRPNWTAHSLTTAAVNETVHLGQNTTNSTLVHAKRWTDADNAGAPAPVCILSPNGDRTMPDGTTPWLDHWKKKNGWVPVDIPLGRWAGYSDASCSTAMVTVSVMPEGAAHVAKPVYGVQLVVWRAV